MLSVIVLVVVVGLVYAQQPPCCTGKQWEANEFYQLGTVEGGKPRYIEGYVIISYDEDKQMINRLVYEKENGTQKQFQLLEDFNQKVAYQIVSVNCTKYVINTPFTRACIPVNSSRFGSPLLFGSQDKPIVTTVYAIPELEGQNGYITVSADDCTPVMENLEGSIKGTIDLEFKGYSNFTNGIKDPSIFNVPPQCESVQVINSDPSPLDRYRTSGFFRRSG